MAKASPKASMTVVLEVGARLSGHASFSTEQSRMISLCLARVDPEIASHADQSNIEAFQRGEYVQQFCGLTAVTDRNDHIARRPRSRGRHAKR